MQHQRPVFGGSLTSRRTVTLEPAALAFPWACNTTSGPNARYRPVHTHRGSASM